MRLIRLPLPTITVFAVSTTLVFVPSGDWRPAGGLSKARSSAEMRGRNGLTEAGPALQFANFEDATGATAVAVGTAMVTDGYSPPAATYTDISSQSAQYRLVRPGFLVRLTSGTTTGFAYATGVVEIVPA